MFLRRKRAAPSQPAPEPITVGDRYTVERELGRGGMATVYLARDRKHDRPVAIKIMRPEVAADQGGQRFLREIQILARLQHPNILALLDSGTTGEASPRPFYVMPYVEGESLRQRLAREGPLAVAEALRLVREIGEALHYAHGEGLVHRDVKPENVLLSQGHALVADFGIARAAGVAAGQQLTQPGLGLGTPAYMSPEQTEGDRGVDARADQYSLACVLYELLAGQPPFTGPTIAAVLSRQLLDPVPPITTLRPGVPAPMRAAIERALSKVAADRFATVMDFLAAVEAPEAAVTAVVSAPTVTPKTAIVVLPFANLSPDPDNAYFADGLMEEVIADLSRVRALTVISRTSSVKLKETGWDLRRIGRELNVRYALEGSVRRAGSGAPDHGAAHRDRDRGSPLVGEVLRHGGRRVRSAGAAVAQDRRSAPDHADAAGGPRDRGAADRRRPRVRVLPARPAGVLPLYRRGDGGGASAGGAWARAGGTQRGAVRDARHRVRLVARRAARRRRGDDAAGGRGLCPQARSSSTRARRRVSRSWGRSRIAGGSRARRCGC